MHSTLGLRKEIHPSSTSIQRSRQWSQDTTPFGSMAHQQRKPNKQQPLHHSCTTVRSFWRRWWRRWLLLAMCSLVWMAVVSHCGVAKEQPAMCCKCCGGSPVPGSTLDTAGTCVSLLLVIAFRLPGSLNMCVPCFKEWFPKMILNGASKQAHTASKQHSMTNHTSPIRTMDQLARAHPPLKTHCSPA